MQKHRGDKLPRICVAHAAMADSEVIANKSRLIKIDNQLAEENEGVYADEKRQNNLLALS